MDRPTNDEQLNSYNQEPVHEAKSIEAAVAAPKAHTSIAKCGKTIGQKQLINEINHLNFQNRSLFVLFKHHTYPRVLTLKAFPLPCQSAQLVCRWDQSVDLEQLKAAYRFDGLHIPSEQCLLRADAQIQNMDHHQIILTLPENCHEVGMRTPDRHTCGAVAVNLFQNGACFFGHMIDFNGDKFRVNIRTEEPQTFHWIDDDTPVTVILGRGRKTLYSGECRVLRQTSGLLRKDLLLEPYKLNIRRFKKREFRCTREKLVPSPNAVFEHPFFPATITLKIGDISGTGFSVHEKPRATVLMPGMIIPGLQIIFSDGSGIQCIAQVIYRTDDMHTNSSMIRCGLVFLDIQVEDHFRLLAMLQQAGDANSYFCGKVDTQALWKFFFESSFIYPQKYKFIEANKEIIKSTYQKLYNQSSGISSHFIYQESGRIVAHMAMLRFYERAWLIHHHAAVRGSNPLAGLLVLDQVSRFIIAGHRLNALKMDFVFCYFRPENKFPSHVFGRTAEQINNPQVCSVDNFAYYHHRCATDAMLPLEWQMKETCEEDLRDLRIFYDSARGGLMLRVMQLEAGLTDCTLLTQTFRKFGLKRERHLLSLYCRRKLSAVIMVNQSDLGLNMSDLTNSVTIIVVDHAHLTRDIMTAAVQRVARYYEQEEIPILVFPTHAAEKIGIAIEKTYSLWIYNTQNLDHYFRCLKRYFKFVHHDE